MKPVVSGTSLLLRYLDMGVQAVASSCEERHRRPCGPSDFVVLEQHGRLNSTVDTPYPSSILPLPTPPSPMYPRILVTMIIYRGFHV